MKKTARMTAVAAVALLSGAVAVNCSTKQTSGPTGPDGMLSEGSGQNLFLVQGGTLYTPTINGTLLHGITRSSILMLARDLGIPVREEPLPREMLYGADEVFFCGTAAEVTPVRSVDHIKIGTGRPGPVTLQLQQRFLQIARGEVDDPHGWLTYVRAERASAR